MDKEYKKGSEWLKWDLHFHTPSSYDYKDKSVTNEQIIEELSKNKISLVAITDHHIIDTERIKVLKELGIKENITVLPGIEFLSDAIGSEPVHFIAIFPEDTNKIDYIWDQLKNRTAISKIEGENKKHNEVYCDLKDTINIIKELGGIITIHAGNKSNSIESITNSLPHTIAQKKDIAEIIDIFELGKESDQNDYINIVFPSIKQIIPMIICSDNHDIKKYELKQNCWIKANPTFEGLKQIIFEPSERIYIGEEPEVEIRVRENQRRYIKSIKVDQIEGYDNRHGSWFKDEEIELNKELVAIIGNKGNGKSALADIIGLLGNSHNQKYKRGEKEEELFSFLNKDKFLKDNCAANFKGKLFWYAGLPDEKILNAKTDESVLENVEYLPQKYLEKICANIEDDEFRDKLNEVIFEYVKDKDKFGQTNLDDLIKYLTNQTDADIKVAKSNLHDINSEVISIEKKLIPDHKNDIKEKIKLKEADIEAHKSIQPKEVEKPKTGSDEAEKLASSIKEIEDKIADLSSKIEDAELESSNVTIQAENLRQASQAIKREIEAISGISVKYNKLFTSEGISFEDIVSIKVSYEKIDDIIKKKEERLVELNVLLRNGLEIKKLNLPEIEEKDALEKSLVCNKLNLENKKKEIIDQLDKPNREYQSYISAQTQWQLRLKELEGEIENPLVDTLNWFKSELENINNVYPKQLEDIKKRRVIASKDVLVKKKSLINFYEAVKLSIDEEIKKYGTDLGEYNISIEASLKFDQIFYDDFFEYVNQHVKGSFHGTEDGKSFLKKNIEEISDWEDEEEVVNSLENIVSLFHNSDGEDRDIFKQMKQRKDPLDLYDYIFGFDYLKTKYDLRVDDKDLIELSPGERGGLLLIFYLMLDRRDIPLIIDQPEDNLDNKSVYEILVTFLKKAKKRRQIIIVTHNPNLAVVADAEQIIYVSINKKDSKNDFDFISGSIENPKINKLVIDILEGTLPAFDNRKIKYKRS